MVLPRKAQPNAEPLAAGETEILETAQLKCGNGVIRFPSQYGAGLFRKTRRHHDWLAALRTLIGSSHEPGRRGKLLAARRTWERNALTHADTPQE